MNITKRMYEELSQKIKQIELCLQRAPEGYLKVNKRGDKNVYYHVTKKDGKDIRRYLKIGNSQDEELKKLLAEKQYYLKLLPVAITEKKTLEHLLQNYHPGDKYEIFEKIPQSRKTLITPLFRTPEDITRAWEQEEWKANDKYIENLKYETNRGELVRSKSEIIIADMLYYNQNLCAYRYEAPLYLQEKGITIFPDFTIMKRRTAEIMYWEHFGMMDDEEYVNNYILKINEYISAGIFPGKQLICTFESSTTPLDTRIVRELINEYLR